MRVTQVELSYVFDRMICWLPGRETDFHEGMRLSLDKQPRIWTVSAVYGEQDHYEINRKWPVGGLPK